MLVWLGMNNKQQKYSSQPDIPPGNEFPVSKLKSSLRGLK